MYGESKNLVTCRRAAEIIFLCNLLKIQILPISLVASASVFSAASPGHMEGVGLFSSSCFASNGISNSIYLLSSDIEPRHRVNILL